MKRQKDKAGTWKNKKTVLVLDKVFCTESHGCPPKTDNYLVVSGEYKGQRRKIAIYDLKDDEMYLELQRALAAAADGTQDAARIAAKNAEKERKRKQREKRRLKNAYSAGKIRKDLTSGGRTSVSPAAADRMRTIPEDGVTTDSRTSISVSDASSGSPGSSWSDSSPFQPSFITTDEDRAGGNPWARSHGDSIDDTVDIPYKVNGATVEYQNVKSLWNFLREIKIIMKRKKEATFPMPNPAASLNFTSAINHEGTIVGKISKMLLDRVNLNASGKVGFRDMRDILICIPEFLEAKEYSGNKIPKSALIDYNKYCKANHKEVADLTINDVYNMLEKMVADLTKILPEGDCDPKRGRRSMC